ncbi:TraX family protein [Pseudomonas sp.]|uniref:TraX family protein n=1 Tax=Pseudomonas sp. TaxID=306 RepID=UPI0025F9B195|nr:TraX family protein [Pseudomonas sp.]
MAPPSLVIADGTLEALKWLGLFLMTIDHVNKYLFNGTCPAAFAAGRLALPIFVMVLAYNLARPNSLARGVYRRTAGRLLTFGVLATPAFLALGGLVAGAYPLNILFTLLVATVVIQLLDCDRPVAAVIAFGIGGALVEFWWPAIGLCVVVWLYARRSSWTCLVLGIVCCASLQVINGNAWALAAIPVFLIAMHWKLTMRRRRWVFQAYYPLHLMAICLIRIPMAKAGYLFL